LLLLKSAALAAGLLLAGRLVLWIVFRQVMNAPASLVAGALALYVAMLATGKIAWALVFVIALAAVELTRSRRIQVHCEGVGNRWWEWVLAGLLLITTVVNPFTEWDPRSIWFYHAKVIFFHGFDAEVWRYVSDENDFSHPFYPELVPALAGAAAWVYGFWNDYLPKFGLALLTAPAMLLGGSLFPTWRGRALFWVITLLALHRFLWNGYMDGPLALWSSVTILHIVAGLIAAIPRERAVIVAALGLAVCAGLKVEGWVIDACIVASLIAAVAFRWDWPDRTTWPGYARAAIVAIVPYAAWRLYCNYAGVASGWASLSSDYISRAMARSTELPAIANIAREMFRATILVSFAALAAALVLLRGAGRRWTRAAAFGVMTLAGYLLALFFVYLGTPIDLDLHLRTSVARTMLPPRMWLLALLVACYLIWLREWEPNAQR